MGRQPAQYAVVESVHDLQEMGQLRESLGRCRDSYFERCLLRRRLSIHHDYLARMCKLLAVGGRLVSQKFGEFVFYNAQSPSHYRGWTTVVS